MRLTRSMLLASLLALGAGTAVAGQDSKVSGSVETSPPELLSGRYMFESSDAYIGPMPEGPADELALEEVDVIYIYPMEVTEYYLLIPSD